MNKEELIDLLKEYKKNQAKKDLRILEKKRLLKAIGKIDDDYEVSITPIYQEGSKGNQVTSKVENKVVKKDEKVEDIEKRIKDLDEEIEDLDYKLKQIDIRLGSLKRIEKEVITAFYVDEMDPYDIGNDTYYRIKHQTRSEKTIKRMIEKITEKLLKL